MSKPASVALPFIPEPYPDEVLGSVFARAALLSGLGAWRSLLRHIGIRVRSRTPFDLLDPGAQTMRLLDGLGVSYDDAAYQLTTLPYWQALSGSDRCPMPNYSATRLLMHGKYIAPTSSRWFCHVCLREDVRERRTPYWRRTHQLPTVFFCPEHQVALQDSCMRCRSFLHQPLASDPEALSARCACGFDLRTRPGKRPQIDSFFLRLTEVSIEALSTRERPPWNFAQLRTRLKAHPAVNIDRRGRSIQRFLMRTIPNCVLDQDQWRFEVLGTRRALWLRTLSALSSAPAIAVTIAAVGESLEDATCSLRMSERVRTSHRQSKRRHEDDPHSIELTQEMVLRQDRSKHAYWLRRIADASGDIPSIEDDRISIQTEWERSATPKTLSAARARARIRDTEWYGSAIASNVQAATSRSKAQTEIQAAQTEAALRAGMEVLLRRSGRPLAVTEKDLLKVSGLKPSDLARAFRRSPTLRDDYEQTKRRQLERRLAWAAIELYLEGALLSVNAIFQRAQVANKEKYRIIVRELVAKLPAPIWTPDAMSQPGELAEFATTWKVLSKGPLP